MISFKEYLEEGNVIQFPKKHPFDTITHCPKCETALQGGKTAGKDGTPERVKVCTSCMTIYKDTRNIVKEQNDLLGPMVGGDNEQLSEARTSKIQPNTTSKVMSGYDLVQHIGKTRANAVFKHPFHQKHFNMQSMHPNVYRVDVDQHGFPTVSASNGFTFEHRGHKIRRMVQFALSRNGSKVYNAHLFHNHDDERHRPEHGGGPMWHYIESQHNDDEK